MPCVNGNIGSFKWIALIRIAVYRVGRQEKFHALDIPCRRAVPLVHITTTDPLRARRHPDLITSAIVADRSANGVGAMTIVVARLGRIVSTRVADTIMNGVMPIVIVIDVLSVPTAVMRLKRVMRPALTRVCSSHSNALSSKAQRPNVRRVCVGDSRFDRCRNLRLRNCLNSRNWLRDDILNMRIALHPRHIGAGCQRLGDLM